MKAVYIFLLLAMLVVGAYSRTSAEEIYNAEDYYTAPEYIPSPIVVEEITEEPILDEIKENEKKYRYIYTAPITLELQQCIFDICEKYGISFEFVMAVIAQESSFRPDALGDGGYSKGLMQIQERFHSDVMEELGVTDLYDPLQNVETGVKILANYFKEHEDVYHVLMRYNGGAPYARRMMKAGKVSDYAREIVERAMEYERENGI